MRALKWFLGALAGTLLLSGCQSAPIAPGQSTEIPVGSVLELHKRLVVTSADDYIRFYRGAVVADSRFRLAMKYDPSCRLVMHLDVNDYNHVIVPGGFQIYAVKQFDDYEIVGPRIVASNGSLLQLAADGGIMPQEYATVMYLRSAQQPQVDRLVCSHFQFSTDGVFLNVDQIRAVLGDIFTLHLAH